MANSVINIGQLANDGTGDDLREAFIKVNNKLSCPINCVWLEGVKIII